MSTSSRSGSDESSYHHGNLRQALVDQGLVLLEEAAPGDFSLRELARRVGVSANAAYRHFENKEALLAALAAEGFRRFSLAQLQAAQDSEEPFLASGCAYVAFARHHPALFRLMFGRFGAVGHSEEMTQAGEFAYQGLRQLVASALGRPVEAPETELAALQAWSLVHGLSHLALDGQLERYGEAPGQMVERVLRQAMGTGAAEGHGATVTATAKNAGRRRQGRGG